MEIFKEYSFEAAHRLPEVPKDHKCRGIHGHRYSVRLHLQGSVGIENGWLIDFGGISDVFDPILKTLDHSCLNDIDGLENPTCEMICRWLWQRLKSKLPDLSQIVVQETPSSGCIYRGEDESA